MLFINVTNSCGKLNSKKTNKLHTTKSGDHGYGMEIINKIAEKYNGEGFGYAGNFSVKIKAVLQKAALLYLLSNC